MNDSFQPAIHCISEVGAVTEVIKEIADKDDVALIVMGTHGSGMLDSLLMGNHSRRMIDATKCPLLLVPSSAAVKPIKK